MYFFVDEEEKCREKQLYFAVNSKVSQSLRNKVFFFFFFFKKNEGAKVLKPFFYIKLNIIRVVLLTQYFHKNVQQNLGGKL